jgi:hypothetical protein
MKMKFKQVPRAHSNGFRFIRDQVGKSNNRICSVKFGVPFAQICENDSRLHTYEQVEQAETESKESNNLLTSLLEKLGN